MKKSGRFILILVILLLLIAMGVGGYFLVKISKDSSNKINSLENEIETLKSEKKDTDIPNKNEVSSDTKKDNAPVSKNENNSNKKSETEVANEAIRKALKDEKWIKENIYGSYSGTYEAVYGNNWYDEAKKELVFAKITDKDSSMTLYIVGSNSFPAGSDFFMLVQYKNGKVVSEWVPEPDYGFATFDLNNGIVCSVSDFQTTYQEIRNGEFVEFAREDGDDVDREVVYYYNDTECTKADFEKHIKDYNFKKIQTELTEENINQYVK